MNDYMPAIYAALNWPEELRPKPQPEPHIVTDRHGAAVGIDWQTLIETSLIKTEGMGQ